MFLSIPINIVRLFPFSHQIAACACSAVLHPRLDGSHEVDYYFCLASCIIDWTVALSTAGTIIASSPSSSLTNGTTILNVLAPTTYFCFHKIYRGSTIQQTMVKGESIIISLKYLVLQDLCVTSYASILCWPYFSANLLSTNIFCYILNSSIEVE